MWMRLPKWIKNRLGVYLPRKHCWYIYIYILKTPHALHVGCGNTLNEHQLWTKKEHMCVSANQGEFPGATQVLDQGWQRFLSIKYLLWNHEAPGFGPQNPGKFWAWWHVLAILAPGRWRQAEFLGSLVSQPSLVLALLHSAKATFLRVVLRRLVI